MKNLKRLIITLIICLGVICLNSQTVPEKLGDTPPDWWKNKSDSEKYILYKTAYNTAIDLRVMQSDNEVIQNNLISNLEKSNKILKSVRYNRFGLNLMALAGIDRTLKTDVYTGLNFSLFFLEGRGQVSIGTYLKIYSELGGALSLSVGFNF